MTRAVRVFITASMLALLALVAVLSGQGAAPPMPLMVLSRDSRFAMPTTIIGGQEMVALDDLAGPFRIAIREEPLANAVRVTYKDRFILLTPDQTLVSVGGRLVSLPAPLTRAGVRLLVPVEFINRAFALVFEEPIELRKEARLLIVGALKVPRVDLRYETLGSDLRIVFDMAPTVGQAIVQEPRRLLIRLEADAIDATIPPPPPAQTLLTGAKVLDRNTIEIDLGQRFGSYRSSVASSTPASTRVLVDLLARGPETTAAPGAPAVPPPGPGISPDEAILSLSAPRTAIRTIVIDPGHGGTDAGTRGATGVLEKDITLAIARRLKGAIEARYGIRVLQTRDDDRLVGPDERASYANNNKADLFISLHANASPQRDVKGAEVFYLGLDKYADEARRQAQQDGAVLPVFGGGSRQIDLVVWDLAQAKFVDQSGALARLVEAQLRDKVDVSPFAIQQGPMRVLGGVNMPAVLIEMGYLTNPAQEKALASAGYQDTIAQALTEAVAPFRDYLEHGSEQPVTQAPSSTAAPATFAR